MIQPQDERVIIEYDDTTRAWNDWKYGNIIQKSLIHERYVLSIGECIKMYNTYDSSSENTDRMMLSVPSLVRIEPERAQNCHICRKYQGQLYPCRICGKVYHQQCVKDIGNMRSHHLIKNTTGWSCPTCEDLRVLLSTEELTETNEWIKSLGTHIISDLDHYINIRMKSKSSISSYESTDHIKTILQNFLNTLPDITSNQLLQPDLFMLDICLKIVNIPSKFLVHFLTEFELYRLSQLFLSLSSVDHQCLTSKKFDQILHRYLQRTLPELNSNEKHSHSEALAYTFLDPTAKFDRTWPQFILDATIPTLLGRLHHRTFTDFNNRILSTAQSTTPRTTNYRNSQSMEISINNVLKKLM